MNNYGNKEFYTRDVEKESKNEREFRDWLEVTGVWSALTMTAIEEGKWEDYDGTFPETIYETPADLVDEMYDYWQASKIAEDMGVTISGTTLGTEGYDVTFISDRGNPFKTEIKHRFIGINSYPDKVQFLERRKHKVMKKAKAKCVLFLYAIAGHPEICDWALWRTEQFSDGEAVIAKGGSTFESQRNKQGFNDGTGYFLKDAKRRGRTKND